MGQRDTTGIPVREGLRLAMNKAWQGLGEPGTWWTGPERIAIAQEARQAMQCEFCRQNKAALSPFHHAGNHDSLGRHSAPLTDAIHRIRTDAGRLTESWLNATLAQGLGDTQYVEIVCVVAVVSAVDTYDRAMGHDQRTLPAAGAGEPSRHRPSGAKPGLGWLATLAPADIRPEDPDPFVRFGQDHIQRAMSLVPQAVIDFFELDVELYFYENGIPQRYIQEKERALSLAQIEMMAARAASINGCYY
ncbi:MAG: hypothetical protein HOI34_02330 [Rhodospirillaceae bacterium]|nr:hypothetical protein [Rhodospirillaceae bacterium]MBT6202520.1 hypothetical protein [Rhodospirillaceae bacterium]MBT6512745.1 hypothetical protein [Rhodospirillaceae bacterium]MBT7615635.1 hypothetical protein [Rhodospirillaceae bacterium]